MAKGKNKNTPKDSNDDEAGNSATSYDGQSHGPNINQFENSDDYDDDSHNSMSRNDPSFASFVNSTHNLDDEPEYEVVFHNDALMKML